MKGKRRGNFDEITEGRNWEKAGFARRSEKGKAKGRDVKADEEEQDTIFKLGRRNFCAAMQRGRWGSAGRRRG